MTWLLGVLSFALVSAKSFAQLPVQQPIDEQTASGHFGYTKAEGPISWYAIDSNANKLCATGKNQSPINIERGNTSLSAHQVWVDIPTLESAEIKNLGHTVEVMLEGKGKMIYPFPNGQVSILQQIHFHTPSEHHFDGEHDELEMHAVFKDSKGALSVVAQMFKVSSQQSAKLIVLIVDQIEKVATPGSTSRTGPLVFDEMTNHWWAGPTYTYPGSLTTPPCSEDVTWFVNDRGLPVYVNTYMRLKNIVKFNSRVLQNQYGGENLLMGTAKELKCKGVV